MSTAVNLEAMGWGDQLALLGLLRTHEPMARHTTLGVGGPARWFFRPQCRAAMIEAMGYLPADLPLLPLGRGSNMLMPDAGFDGMVIDLSDLNELQLGGCKQGGCSVSAGAGARMSRFARVCADHGLTGCEFMATVPGDIGGGVAMNAGCFSQQVSDVLVSIEVLLRDGSVEMLAADELQMTYRHTRLPEGALILAATFELQSDHPEAIRERMRAMRERRSSTQPLAQPNCGSVFKNPQGDHAARLIEAAGLKGFAIGGAAISEQHANFIVNRGDATSADIVALIQRAQAAVLQQSGIELEPEVRLVGEWQDLFKEGEDV